MSIYDTADDYVHRKQAIARYEAGDSDREVPSLSELRDDLKAALDAGEVTNAERVDPKTGEIVPALDLRDSNTRLFLRDTAGASHACPACGETVGCRKPSRSLVMEPIESLAVAAKGGTP